MCFHLFTNQRKCDLAVTDLSSRAILLEFKFCLRYILTCVTLSLVLFFLQFSWASAVCLVMPSGPSLCNPIDCSPPGSSVHSNSPGQNTGVGSCSLLQGIFPTQGLNPGLPHCQQILYQLSHKGSPRILEWIVYPFSSGSSLPRNRTRVSCIAGGFFTS